MKYSWIFRWTKFRTNRERRSILWAKWRGIFINIQQADKKHVKDINAWLQRNRVNGESREDAFGFRRDPNFSSYQENVQERDSGGGVSNASLFISIRAISLPLDAASVLVSLNRLDANQKGTANG